MIDSNAAVISDSLPMNDPVKLILTDPITDHSLSLALLVPLHPVTFTEAVCIPVTLPPVFTLKSSHSLKSCFGYYGALP
jgi:hypothetical protein